MMETLTPIVVPQTLALSDPFKVGQGTALGGQS